MRNLLVRSQWSVVRSKIVLVAMTVVCSVAARTCLAQQGAAPQAQDQGPAGFKGGAGGSPLKGGMPQPPKMGGGMGQPAKSENSTEPTLEGMLQKALKDNPDIRVAEAKVREAEAELNRTRLQATQKVLAFHHSRESQKAIIKVAEENLQRIRQLNSRAAVSQEDVRQAEQQLSASKAKLAEIEAEMPYLLGQQQKSVLSSAFSPDGKMLYSAMTDGTIKAWDATLGKQLSEPYSASKLLWQYHPQNESNWFREAVDFQPYVTLMRGTSQESESIVERVRKALDTRIKFDYHQKKTSEILDDLNKKVPGLSIKDLSDIDNISIDHLQIDGEVPVRIALELLEDTCNVLRMNGQPFNARGTPNRLGFVLRDYGLLFVRIDQLPPGAIHLSNIGSGVQIHSSETEKAPAKNEKNPPAAEKKH